MSARDLPLHFCERGADDGSGRPTLVFLHYFGGSTRSWEPVMDILAARGFHCIAPDLRGFGDSPGTSFEARNYSVDAMAQDVCALVRGLGLETFVIVGHSMGGKAALALAATQPDGLTAVVLIAPSPPTSEPISDEERTRLLTAYADVAAATKTLHKITARALAKPLFEMAIADQLRTSEPAWRAWLELGSREDISGRLSAIRVPVVIAVGAEDSTITEALVRREIADRLAASTSVETIPDTGHLLPLEASLATANFVAKAVSREAPAR